MKTYTFKMTRVYETLIVVDAENEQDAFNKLKEIDVYQIELEQCCVVQEDIELEQCNVVYARKCDITGEGMNEGWVANDGEMHFKYEADALQWCIDNGYRDIDDAYADDVIYWTEWEGDE